MFGEYVYDHSPALYSDFILINDSEGLNSRTDYINAFAVHGFEIVEYKDDLSFRIEYEKNLKCGKGKIAVLNEKKAYIPYDILQRLSIYAVSLHTLFPKLNSRSCSPWPDCARPSAFQAGVACPQSCGHSLHGTPCIPRG